MPQSIALFELITEKALFAPNIYSDLSVPYKVKLLIFHSVEQFSLFVIEFAKTYYIILFNVIRVDSKITENELA